MTTRDDFTTGEWETLRSAPWIAGLLVVFADAHITGMAGEFKALWDALRMPESAGAAQDLVAALVREMEEREDDEDSPAAGEDLDQAELLVLIGSAARIVDTKCGPDEAAGYKAWISQAAQATAEASREGWFFGVGGDRVSEKEETAMAEIEAALGR
jgi:hypothetical protein